LRAHVAQATRGKGRRVAVRPAVTLHGVFFIGPRQQAQVGAAGERGHPCSDRPVSNSTVQRYSKLTA